MARKMMWWMICLMILVGCRGRDADLTASKTRCSHEAPDQYTATPDHPAFLPRHDLTPGKVNPHWSREEMMKVGGTQDHRQVTMALKKRVWARYGYDQTIGPYEDHTGEYEIDHLIPNCLGGMSDIDNLWPQPYDGPWNAHVKDKLEVHVRAEVIAGRMGLKEAQQLFVPNWTTIYRKQCLHDVQ